MKLIKYIYLHLILLLLLSLNSNAIDIKIGVVDVVKVIKQMPEAEQGDKYLKDLGKKYYDSLENMQKDLKEKYEAYQKQKAMISTAEQQKTEESFFSQNQLIEKFNQEKFSQQGELAQRREGIMEPIKEKVRKAIEKIKHSENKDNDKGKK